MLKKVDVKLQTPEAFFVQQRAKKKAEHSVPTGNIRLHEETNKAMHRYVRVKSARHNLDLRAEQLKMERELAAAQKRPSFEELETDPELREAAEVLKEANRNDSDVKLYNENLKDAVDSDDSNQINHAILVSFFAEHAPERVDEIDVLLSEYKGKENKLFSDLKEQYPLPEESNLEGESLAEFNRFKTAFDASLETKKKEGRFVLSIVENGGNWWINRQKPALHPSQRKRDTLLPELRAGSKSGKVKLELKTLGI